MDGKEQTTRKTIRLPMVKQKTGLGKTTIYEGVNKGWFPARVRISARAVGWYEDEIDAWLASRPRA